MSYYERFATRKEGDWYVCYRIVSRGTVDLSTIARRDGEYAREARPDREGLWLQFVDRSLYIGDLTYYWTGPRKRLVTWREAVQFTGGHVL
jgi:hypothetical protein